MNSLSRRVRVGSAVQKIREIMRGRVKRYRRKKRETGINEQGGEGTPK